MRITKVENAHTHGVLDPQMRERNDTKFVDGSLDDAANIITLPQGGYIDRGGSLDFGRLRKKLTASPGISSGMFSGPGGNYVYLVDSVSTYSIGADGAGNLSPIAIDFGANVQFDLFELRNAKVIHGSPSAGQTPTAYHVEVELEYFDGSNWVRFGQKITLRSDVDNYARIGFAPGTTPPVARQYRLVFPTLAPNSVFECDQFIAWSETAQMSDVRGYAYRSEDGENYKLFFGDGHLDIYRDGLWLTATPFPAAESVVAELNFEAQFDTVFVTHTSIPPQAVRRSNSDSWTVEPAKFKNIPNYDYGAGYTNGATEKQRITFYDINAGDEFEISVNGMPSTSIVYSTTQSTMINEIKAKIEALKNVGTGVTVTASSDTKFEVEFTGSENERKPWLKMAGYVNNPKSHISVERITEGEWPGEPIISEARGWPAAIKIIQSRALLLGPKSVPNAIIASVLGDPLDLNMDHGGATAAFIWEVDMDTPAPITDAIFSNALVLMTRNGVHFMMNEELSAEDAPDFRSASAPGVSDRAPILRSDNALLYADNQGTALRLLKFSQLDQNYLGENISVLSAFLIKNPQSMALLRSNSRINAEICMMVMEDGSLVTLTMMRTQDVSGFCPHRTEGQFKSVMVDHDNDVWWIVCRDNNGVEELRLEKMELDGLLDSAEEFHYPSGSTVVSGLSRFEGKDIWAIADDEPLGPFTVSGAQISLAEPANNVRVGFWGEPFATDPPLKLEFETERVLARNKRVFEAQVSVLETSSIALSANGGAKFNLSTIELDNYVLGTPSLQNKVSGYLRAEGMPGYHEDGQVTVGQLSPGKLNVRAVTKKVSIN